MNHTAVRFGASRFNETNASYCAFKLHYDATNTATIKSLYVHNLLTLWFKIMYVVFLQLNTE